MKGKKTGGRQKGVPNKTTTLVKQAVLCVYDRLGGDEAFLAWAKKNPTEFYTKMSRALIPHEVQASMGVTLVAEVHDHFDLPKPAV